MGSDTAWMREYERRRSDLLHKADAHGFACANRNATEADRRTRHHDMQDALAALDAHVRGLVEENELLREALGLIASRDLSDESLIARAPLAAPAACRNYLRSLKKEDVE